MSYTGYLITSAKLDLNWWLSLSQCPQGGNVRSKALEEGRWVSSVMSCTGL